MTKFIVAHRKDPNNVGDLASEPLQYFLPRDQYQTVDILDLGKETFSSSIPLIVGGGGLIGNEFIGNNLEKIMSDSDKHQLEKLWKQRWALGNIENSDLHRQFSEEYRLLIKKYIDLLPTTKNLRYIWGAGHNLDAKKDKSGRIANEYPESLLNFNLVGLRDFGTEFEWVPCASCMHPALRKHYAIKNDVIFFEHKKQLIKGTDFGTDPIPRFINSGSNVEQTIELLGSANVILTNSYHGAYWGTLLKKKVIVIGAWSSKFYYMKHTPYFLDRPADYKNVIDDVPIHASALDESITANTMFWNKIKDRS
jgi:hypothetical protein